MTSTAELPPDPMLPRPFRVRHLRRETAETKTIELEAVGGPPGLTFAPGQFTMVYVFGVGEVPMSITGDPARTDRLVHTVRGVGAVSKAIGALKRGDEVGIRGPFGTGWPVAAAEGQDVVVVAGGVGLAPLRPAIYHLLAHRARFGRVWLLYGARTPDDLLYRQEVERWQREAAIEVSVMVDRAPSGWPGAVGVPTQLLSRLPIEPARTVAMTCGPEIMMRYTTRELEHCGLDGSRIFLSMERNMQCAVGFCGHCQFGSDFICRDGPVMTADRILARMAVREV